MIFTVNKSDLGTPEDDWRHSQCLSKCAEGDSSSLGRVVVVSPHPDDEVLALGGTMRMLALAGSELTIVAVTDGEASHPRSVITARALAERRMAERAEALTILGLEGARVVRMTLPDGAVSAADDLVERIGELLGDADTVFAPWHHDGHPDHDAIGAASLIASEMLGKRILQYPVWAWHWARPDTDDIPWPRAKRLPLTDDSVLTKRAGIAAFHSQVEPLGGVEEDIPILPDTVLEHFRRPFEVVFE